MNSVPKEAGLKHLTHIVVPMISYHACSLLAGSRAVMQHVWCLNCLSLLLTEVSQSCLRLWRVMATPSRSTGGTTSSESSSASLTTWSSLSSRQRSEVTLCFDKQLKCLKDILFCDLERQETVNNLFTHTEWKEGFKKKKKNLNYMFVSCLLPENWVDDDNM